MTQFLLMWYFRAIAIFPSPSESPWKTNSRFLSDSASLCRNGTPRFACAPPYLDRALIRASMLVVFTSSSSAFSP